MPGKLFNSPVQHLLVSMHRLVSPHLNLHGGIFGKVYRHVYFSYKNIIDRHLIATARKLAKPGTHVIDVGANIGFFSVAIARHAEVSLLAFEPDRENFRSLGRVTAEYDLGSRIHPYILGLSDTAGAGVRYPAALAP